VIEGIPHVNIKKQVIGELNFADRLMFAPTSQ